MRGIIKVPKSITYYLNGPWDRHKVTEGLVDDIKVGWYENFMWLKGRPYMTSQQPKGEGANTYLTPLIKRDGRGGGGVKNCQKWRHLWTTPWRIISELYLVLLIDFWLPIYYLQISVYYIQPFFASRVFVV